MAKVPVIKPPVLKKPAINTGKWPHGNLGDYLHPKKF